MNIPSSVHLDVDSDSAGGLCNQNKDAVPVNATVLTSTTIRLYFKAMVSMPAPATGGWTVRANGVSKTISSVSTPGNGPSYYVDIVLSQVLAAGQAITVSFNRNAIGANLVDVWQESLALSFTNFKVTNPL